ncbi:MAG TPA: DUF952 domain-containing protein [Vicinamibacterales bacterium]|nr:DUF952 domain-containing protein [Vicinamibacterales bacterium]
MTPQLIFKIVTQDLWRAAEATGTFAGSQVDVDDGYIHFSTAEQMRDTAARHFGGQPDLLLVAVPVDRLGDALKWEPSRGGQLFPHLYAPLRVDDVAWVKPLPVGADRVHVFPDNVDRPER